MTHLFRKDLGISLAGGGIKAYSQIGVLQYFEELGIVAQGYSGTSMGSIVAAFAAAGLPADTISDIMLAIEDEVIKNKLLRPSNAQVFPLLRNDASGLISPKKFVEILQKQLDKYGMVTFDDLKYPLIVNAVDLNSGRNVLFTNRKHNLKNKQDYIVVNDAKLIDALQASCSFPMVFETMVWRDYQLVDGGVLMNAPVLPLKQNGFEDVISITMGLKNDYKTTKHVFDIASRVMEIIINEADTLAIEYATYNINVFDKELGIFSVGKGKKAIDLGYSVAKEHHDHLVELKTKRESNPFQFFK